ncbi:hypothetical protein [Mucilaginibacter paludis]|uniref:Uncharacterized protein n=1 Tax=Mucilaginibacter paludis DSM 18603 TaxID=714943 RepID=H1YH88_9SPHI|nr:hypothetical protein [Mucilaginibacter paludis]EHQ24590.1 hypothetical protein Mucpa_0395 [Mucilaginibacter paludis DSM 18603]
MKPLLSITLLLWLFLCACNDHDNNDQAKEVDKKGAIEVTLSTNHIDSLKDQITTHYIVWLRGSKIKEFDVKDTVQSLGVANVEGEDDAGDTKTVKAQQDYDFFVTVK